MKKIKCDWGIITNPIHVYPMNDLRLHEVDGAKCWCNPTIEEDGIAVHHSMDRREEYEQGRKLN